MSASYDHIWYWRSRLPERKGQACRVLARGSRNSVLVEFADGALVVTSRYAVRRQAAPAAPAGAAARSQPQPGR